MRAKWDGGPPLYLNGAGEQVVLTDNIVIEVGADDRVVLAPELGQSRGIGGAQNKFLMVRVRLGQ